MVDKTRAINRKAIKVFGQKNKLLEKERKEKCVRCFSDTHISHSYCVHLSIRETWTHNQLPSTHKGAI